jgi:hypothetical protein
MVRDAMADRPVRAYRGASGRGMASHGCCCMRLVRTLRPASCQATCDEITPAQASIRECTSSACQPHGTFSEPKPKQRVALSGLTVMPQHEAGRRTLGSRDPVRLPEMVEEAHK